MAVNKAAGRNLTVAVVAMGMIASACSTSEGDVGNALPPAPEVREVRVAALVVPDDGLIRIIVTIPDDRDISSHRVDIADSEDSVGIVGTLEANDDVNALSFDDLLNIPSDSTLIMRDEVLGYLGPDDIFVPLSQIDAKSSEFDPGLADEADKVAHLSALPGVVTVRTITPSTFAVSATSTDAIEALGLEMAEDTFLSFSTDPYEPYQWALENDGSSLANVGLPQTPSQSADADVDGLEARDGATGRGVVVAVIDAGVDFSHPDLAHAQWLNESEDCAGTPNGVDDDGNGFVDDCGGWDFGDDDATPSTEGTMSMAHTLPASSLRSQTTASGSPGLHPTQKSWTSR